MDAEPSPPLTAPSIQATTAATVSDGAPQVPSEIASIEPIPLGTPNVKSTELAPTDFPAGSDDVYSHQCLGNLEQFAYAPFEKESGRGYQPPLEPWNRVRKFDSSAGFWDEFQLLIARKSGDQTELWVFNYHRSQDAALIKDTEQRNILIISAEGLVLEQISAYVPDSSGVYVNQLFKSADGSIWGANVSTVLGEDYPVDVLPLLSRFNEETRQFEFDDNSPKVPVLEHTMGQFSRILIWMDNDDQIWLANLFDALYQYDTNTGETQKLAESSQEWFRSATMGPNGDVYLLRFIPPHLEYGFEIWKFDQRVGQLKAIPSSPDEKWPPFNSLLFDQNGMLWLGSVGFWDPIEDQWHLKHTQAREYIETFTNQTWWYPPSILLESSNGIIWFSRTQTSHSGAGWLNPTTGDSCWFTGEDYSVTLIEDTEFNLWLMTTNELFSLSLSEFSQD